jgi:hypothetical protein
MKWKTWMSGAVLLKFAALAALPVGAARAADAQDLMRAVREATTQVAFAPDVFGRKAASVNFHTKAMNSGQRQSRTRGGKTRR